MRDKIIAHVKDAFGLEDEEAQEILDSYLETYGTLLGDMEKSLAENNVPEMRRAAHTLKGCALNCGDMESSEIACKMQSDVDNGVLDNYAQDMARVKEIFSKF